MPIGSFLGHRSQATDQVRHISGHNVTEFKEFLLKYSDIFSVTDDYVVLRSVLDKRDENGERVKIERFVEEKPIDSYLANRLVSVLEEQTIKLTRTSDSEDREQYLAECVKSSIPLRTLFESVKEAVKGEPRIARLVTTIDDLETLLKMNSRSFHVQSNMVSITEECASKLLKPEANASTVGSYLNSNSSSLYNLNSLSSLINQSQSLNNVAATNPNTSSDAANDSLRLNGSIGSNPQASPPTSLSSSSSNTSSSNRILNNTSTAGFLNVLKNTLQQRQRDEIIRTLKENREPRANGYSANPRHPHYYFPFQNERNFDKDLLSQISIITNLKDGENLINHLIAHQVPVAIDIEGINLNVNGQITLVQMALREDPSFPKLTCLNKGADLQYPRIYVFDVLFNVELMRGPLKQLFESSKVMKVFHDCRNSSACLNSQFQIQLQNVFDLQVAHSVLDQQLNGKPVYKPKFMSMKSLCDRYTIEFNYEAQVNKKSIKRNFKRDNQYWGQRPLKDEMLFYASIDVFLIMRYLFDKLKDDIFAEYYPLLEQLNEEAILAKISPEDVKKQKKKRKTDMEVMDLKNKLFNRKAELIVLSNREIRLLR